MHRITIITENPILKKLLSLMMAQLPESAEPVVLLDAAQLDRLDTFSGSRVIVFTASADPAYLAAAREAGVAGFCYLQPSLEELAQVLRGTPAFPGKAPAVPLGKGMSSALTSRELEVLRELVTGKTDAEIGAALSLAIPTVKHHVQQLFFKTGFSNRTQLAVAAVSTGLIRTDNHTFG